MQRVKLQITAVEVRHRLNLSGRGFLDLLKKNERNEENDNIQGNHRKQ